MSIKVIFSPYNPIPFYEKDYAKPPEYNYTHPRRSFAKDNAEPQDLDKPWYQPVCSDQYICIQLKRGYAGTAEWNYAVLNFQDKDGKFIDFINPTQYYTLTGDVDEFGEQLYAIQFCFKPSDVAALSGHEYVSMRILVHFGDGSAINVGDTVYDFTSEIIHLADVHEDTCLIEASKNNNTYDGTYFEFPEIFPKYQLRVPAGRMKPIPAGEYTVFNDQRQSAQVLHAEPFNKYTWDVYNVPVRVLDSLNFYLKCDNVRIDGWEYVLESDGTGDSSSGAPRQSTTYTFTDKDRDKTLQFDEVTFLLWERPVSSYNYGLSTVGITDGYNVFFKLSQIFENSTAEGDYVTALNVAAAAATSTGECFEAGGKYYFKNGPGQRFRPIALPKVLPKEMIVTYSISNAPRIPNFVLYYADSLQHVVLFKDTTGSGDAVAFTNTGLLTTITKTYGSNGTVAYRLFHNDEEIEYGMNTPGVYPKITNITGLASSRLQKIHFQNNNLTAHTTFPIDFLSPAKNILHTLIIKNSLLQGITAGWASGLVSGGIKPFPLKYVDISLNSVDVTNLDTFINEVYNSCAWPSGPYIFLCQGQSPIATPSASTAAIDDMEDNYGWDFTTD